MCDAKRPAGPGSGPVLTTPSGAVLYTPNTPAGRASIAAAMAAAAGPGSGEAHHPPPPQENPTPPEGCDNYDDSMWEKPCSKYYKYMHMGFADGQPRTGPGSKPADNPEANLTVKQIACNWQKTCKNILDPLVDAGWKFRLNSCYRTPQLDKQLGAKNGLGDHPAGRAADLMILDRGPPAAGAKELFKYIGKNLPFSQLLYEGVWVHVAYGGGTIELNKVLFTKTGKLPFFGHGSFKDHSKLDPDLRWA